MGMTGQVAKAGNNLSSDQHKVLEFPYEILSSKVILIGKLNVDSIYNAALEKFIRKTYYDAYYNGKQFYISTNDVELNTENIFRLDSLRLATESVQDHFNIEVKKLALALYLRQIDEILNYYEIHKPYGLSIVTWRVYDESEYTDGTGFSIDVINPTKKTIKYITLNLIGYNSVNDRVLSKGEYAQSVRYVGPIEPNDPASYSFKYVWFTDMVKSARVASITVQYMDGTRKSIKSITWANEDAEYYMKEILELQEIKMVNEENNEKNRPKSKSDINMPELNILPLIK